MRVFISAGHWLKDSGAVYAGTKESEIVIKIRNELKKLCPEFIYVPDEYNLSESINWINEMCQPDDVAVEIHLNQHNNKEVSGTEAYYYKSPTLSAILSRNVAKSIGLSDRGVRHDSESFLGELGFLRNTNCQTALVEIGYLSCAFDRSKIMLPGGCRLCAEGMRNGIIEYKGQAVDYKQQLASMYELLTNLLKQMNNNGKYRLGGVNLSSSVNPEQLGTMVKGIITALSSLIVLICAKYGLSITEAQVVVVASQIGLAVSSLITVYGLIQKFIVAISKKE